MTTQSLSNASQDVVEFHYDMVVVVQNFSQGIYIFAWHCVSVFNEEQGMSYVQCLTRFTIASEENSLNQVEGWAALYLLQLRYQIQQSYVGGSVISEFVFTTYSSDNHGQNSHDQNNHYGQDDQGQDNLHHQDNYGQGNHYHPDNHGQDNHYEQEHHGQYTHNHPDNHEQGNHYHQDNHDQGNHYHQDNHDQVNLHHQDNHHHESLGQGNYAQEHHAHEWLGMQWIPDEL